MRVRRGEDSDDDTSCLAGVLPEGLAVTVTETVSWVAWRREKATEKGAGGMWKDVFIGFHVTGFPFLWPLHYGVRSAP